MLRFIITNEFSDNLPLFPAIQPHNKFTQLFLFCLFASKIHDSMLQVNALAVLGEWYVRNFIQHIRVSHFHQMSPDSRQRSGGPSSFIQNTWNSNEQKFTQKISLFISQTCYRIKPVEILYAHNMLLLAHLNSARAPVSVCVWWRPIDLPVLWEFLRFCLRRAHILCGEKM